MSGSIPEPDVVTASTGMSPIVRPGLYGRSSFRIESALPRTNVARSGFVGPRLSNVVPAALYAGAVADGRSWKYRGHVNDWAASFEPTIRPFTWARLPVDWCGNATTAKPVSTSGYA